MIQVEPNIQESSIDPLGGPTRVMQTVLTGEKRFSILCRSVRPALLSGSTSSQRCRARRGVACCPLYNVQHLDRLASDTSCLDSRCWTSVRTIYALAMLMFTKQTTPQFSTTEHAQQHLPSRRQIPIRIPMDMVHFGGLAAQKRIVFSLFGHASPLDVGDSPIS